MGRDGTAYNLRLVSYISASMNYFRQEVRLLETLTNTNANKDCCSSTCAGTQMPILTAIALPLPVQVRQKGVGWGCVDGGKYCSYFPWRLYLPRAHLQQSRQLFHQEHHSSGVYNPISWINMYTKPYKISPSVWRALSRTGRKMSFFSVDISESKRNCMLSCSFR